MPGRRQDPQHELHRGGRRGGLLRPEDRLHGQGCHRPRVAAGHRPGRLQPAGALRPVLHRRRQPGAPPRDDPPRPLRVDGAFLRRADRALRGGLPRVAGSRTGAARANQRQGAGLRQEPAGATGRGRLPRDPRRTQRQARSQDSAGRAGKSALHPRPGRTGGGTADGQHPVPGKGRRGQPAVHPVSGKAPVRDKNQGPVQEKLRRRIRRVRPCGCARPPQAESRTPCRRRSCPSLRTS